MARQIKQQTVLGRRLKATSTAANLTADQIAEGLGKTGAAIRHWWSGRNEPSFEDLEAYGRLVGRSGYYLLTGQDDPAELEATLTALLAEFGRRLADEEPLVALAGAGGDPSSLDPPARVRLAAAGPRLREYLASAGGESWLRLREEDRELVLSIVWALARRSPPVS